MDIKTNKNQIINQNCFHILSFSLNNADIKKDENFLDPARTGFINCDLNKFEFYYNPITGITKDIQFGSDVR